jgi:zinc protease
MKKTGFLSVLLVLVLVAVFNSCSKPIGTKDSVHSPDRLFNYQELTLDNGLKVITLEDFSSPIVSVQVWYHVGSKNEDPQRQGFAHMFEHMMFKGTDRVGPEEHFELLRRVGGNTNGYTSLDKTVYLETVPADQVELALWLEAERMAFLKIDQESVDTERKVVEEELRSRYDNEPYGNVYKKIAAALFTRHPYRWPPIGNIAHLRASTPQEMRDFWSRYYVPNNATLILAGAIEHPKAQALARRYFGWIQRRPDPPQVRVREPQPEGPRELVIEDEIAPAPLAGIVWRTVPRGHPDEIPLDFLSQILGGGDSSRLYRELVADKQTAVQILATTYNQEQDGIFAIGAMLSPSGTSDEILTSIQTHLQKIRDEGISSEELEKARNNMLKMIVTENLTIESKSSLLAEASMILGDTEKANSYLTQIHAVSREEVRHVAQYYLQDNQKLTVLVKPNNEGKKEDEQAPLTAVPEEAAPPPGRPGEKRPAHFPKTPPIRPTQPVRLTHKYAEYQLDNGIRVLVVQNHEVPFISVMLGLPYGAWCEEKPGAASMAFSMLTKGTAGYTEAQLAEELERRAITLSGQATLDDGTVSMNCLSEHIEEGLRFLSEVVLHPAFDQTEFDKLRRQRITALAVKQKSPDYLADKEFRKRLFGQHPYSRTAEAEAQDLSHLSVSDLQSYWNGFARPEKAVLVFAGDIEGEKALALAKTCLGGWKNPHPLPAVRLPEIPAPQARHLFLVHQPGSTQAQIRVGQLGITRHDQPEYFISRIVGNYFGGSFNGRLNQTIRVEKGLTYGAWGTYIPLNQAGYFIVNTFTKTDSVLETLRTIFDLIEDLRQRPPTDTELSDTKTYIAGSFLLHRETPQQIAEDLWLIESQNLGRDYLDKLFETVRKTTRQECISLINNTLQPDQMIIVVVGDADLLAGPLNSIAPVTRIQTEDALP